MSELAAAARAHVDALRAELDNTQTRDQYIRLTVLAMEADRIATALEEMG